MHIHVNVLTIRLNFNEFDDNERLKFLLQFLVLKLVQLGHVLVIRWRQSLNVKIFPLTEYTCEGLNGGKKFCTTVMTKQMESDLHFIYLSPREFFDISHLVKSCLQQHFWCISVNPIMMRRKSWENIQMRFIVPIKILLSDW